jgi:aspartate racemase
MTRLGILGGMGPAAGAEFYQRLIAQTPADCDQQHIPVVLWGDPTIPDRSTSLLAGDDAPWPLLRRGILGLKAAGCDHVVIPCNTAHFWYDRMATLGVPITHIVDSVAQELAAQGVEHCQIGVLGTPATMRLGLYNSRLDSLGWSCIVPSEQQMTDLVQPAIAQIKSGQTASAHDMFETVIESLIDRGARAVVLGCTEIPLVVRETKLLGIPLINSIDSLAKSAVKKFKIE